MAASELVTAFHHNDFGFAGYRDHIMAHELGKSLVLRHRLARLIYAGWPSFATNLGVWVMSRIWS